MQRKTTTDVLGEAIVDFDQKAKEAEEEESRLEIQAKALICRAHGYRKEVERVLKKGALL